jgi:hypothetical protein
MEGNFEINLRFKKVPARMLNGYIRSAKVPARVGHYYRARMHKYHVLRQLAAAHCSLRLLNKQTTPLIKVTTTAIQ